jgi:hypothetical protein
MIKNAMAEETDRSRPDERRGDMAPAFHQPTSRRGRGAALLKVSLIATALVVLSLGATIILTDREPTTLPARARRWLAAQSWRSSSPPPGVPRAAPDKQVRPEWDNTFDDSGYPVAVRFSKPIDDPASLAQSRDSVAGRGRRGIA